MGSITTKPDSGGPIVGQAEPLVPGAAVHEMSSFCGGGSGKASPSHVNYGRIFLEPACLLPSHAKDQCNIYVNLGSSSVVENENYPDFVNALRSGGVNQQEYEQLMNDAKQAFNAHARRKCCDRGSSNKMSCQVFAGGCKAIWANMRSNKIDDGRSWTDVCRLLTPGEFMGKLNHIMTNHSDKWASHLAIEVKEVLDSPLFVGASDDAAIDQYGIPLEVAHSKSSVWPPMGYNVVIAVSGVLAHKLRFAWYSTQNKVTASTPTRLEAVWLDAEKKHSPDAGEDDALRMLGRLKSLHRQNQLSDKEFEQAARQVLGTVSSPGRGSGDRKMLTQVM